MSRLEKPKELMGEEEIRKLLKNSFNHSDRVNKAVEDFKIKLKEDLDTKKVLGRYFEKGNV